jgi:hypothetical protein
VKVMQVSRANGRPAPTGALGRLRLLTCGLFATALLAGVAALATSHAGTTQGPRAAVTAAGASDHFGATLHDAVLLPVMAPVSHGTNGQRSSVDGDLRLVTVTALVAIGLFVATRRADSPDDVATEHLPQRRAPPSSLSPR